MPKMIAPDKGVKQTDIGRVRYNVNKQGVYSVDDSSHVRAMKREGFIEASLMGATTNKQVGYTCAECGFGSWFRKCSRCGSEN
jgi:lipopolysaccharide biosynthesis regulator YciM